MDTAPGSRSHAIAGLAIAAATLFTLALAWQCIASNIERSCVAGDAPALDLCRSAPPGDLRSRIAANPGDANAYVQLALANPAAPDAGALRAAQRLAPNDPGMLALQASLAWQRQDWAGAVGPLVQLAEYRDLAQPPLALARLIGAGHDALLAPHLQRGSRWFTRVLLNMPQAQVPLSSALGLIAQALKAGVLDDGAVRGYVRQLKAAGEWVDAYSLWLALHGKGLAAIYNAGFDQPLDSDGFDWEVTPAGPPARAGAIVQRRTGEQRGGILDIRFTGRRMSLPLVRQYLFLGAGRYRVRGEYMAHRLREPQSLAWVLQCTATRASVGRSPALGDTAGAWRPFEFEFAVPPGCGAVSSLQLETFDAANAALGASGQMAFDAFTLERLRP